MLISMTGFGRAETNYEGKVITVELRTLNSKNPDLRIRQPLQYRAHEPELRNYVTTAAQRGKMDVSIETYSEDGNEEYSLNKPLFRKYFRDLKAECELLNIGSADLVQAIMRIPKVMSPSTELADENEWNAVMETLKKAVDANLMHRKAEGKAMNDACENHVNAIEKLLKEIPALEDERNKRMRERLHKNISEVVSPDNFNADRYEQEVMYHLDKLDIAEEKTRLQQHCTYFLSTMNTDKIQKGRKLNFISQEMGREINTLGSKAYYSEIQHLVVRMKDELEKIKELLANVV